jgi:hypothetical protein
MNTQCFDGCKICGIEDKSLDADGWCDDCIEMDRNTDWDTWDEKRRRRIAEENEW